jgi:two-component system, CitB family, sensor kinase
VRPLARQLLLLQLVVVALTVTVGAAVTVYTAQERTRKDERDRVLAVALTLAQSPDVAAALDDRDPSRVLQPLAERVRLQTGVAFVVVMNPQRVRYSHTNPARIGKRFVGDIAPALHGRAFTETYTGTLGRSVRSVVPIERGSRVVGLVSVGVLEQTISHQIAAQLPKLLGLAAAALALGTLLSLLLARRVRRQTLGLGPREITRLYEHHDAVLHAIREGVVVAGRDGRLQLVNDEARRLLGLGADPEGLALAEVLPTAPGARDELHVIGGRVLVVNTSTALVNGRPAGTVTTLRDRTELEALVRELDAVRALADSLRAQTHESANQLHTVVGMVELGRYDEAVRFATERVEVAQELLLRLQERVEEPALVALLLGKTALARERGIELVVGERTLLPATGLPAPELVTIVGNLVDNAMDAVADAPEPRIEVTLYADGAEAVVEVRDNGPGIAPDQLERVFEAGWSTKGPGTAGERGLGLALVRHSATTMGGSVAARTEGGAVLTARLPVAAREVALR